MQTAETQRISPLAWRPLVALAYAALGAIGGLACQAPLPDTKIGAVCQKSNDCSYRFDDKGAVVRLQSCVQVPAADGETQEGQPKICTRSCQARTDCPVGFECVYNDAVQDRQCFRCRGNYDCPAGTFCTAAEEAAADGGTTVRTCQEKTVAKDDFGKDCAVGGATDCNAGKGFFCHGEVVDDPDAYCTKTCQSDSDCFVNMFCGSSTSDNVPAGKIRRCFLRSLCSSCRTDAECTGLNSLCVLDDRNRGFCTRPCNPDSPMPCTIAAASKGHLECKPAQKTGGEMASACVPRFGRCYDDGEPCDPCRPHTPEDCQKVNGRHCVQTDKGEGICLQSCTSNDNCMDNSKIPDASMRCTTNGTGKVCAASSAITCWP